MEKKTTNTNCSCKMVNYTVEEADATLNKMIEMTLSEFDAACDKIDTESEHHDCNGEVINELLYTE